MSKHLGNILEPIPLMDEHGADARALVHGRAAARRGRPAGSGTRAIQEIVRKVLLTYWNTASFQALYARRQRLVARRPRRPAVADRPVLDRWALVRGAPAGARGRRRARGLRHPARRPRCSRRTSTTCPTGTSAARAAGSGTATPAALATLHECLYVVTLLMAPLMPFITERVWQDAVRRDRRPSCPSRCTWPRGPTSTRRSSTTSSPTQMALVRRLVELGRAARAERRCGPASRSAGRWSPRRAGTRCPTSCAREVADELNVARARRRSATPPATWSTSRVKGNFRALGKRFGKRTPPVAAAIAAADAGRARRGAARPTARRRSRSTARTSGARPTR